MITEKDKKILGELRANSRMPLTNMSRKLGLPVSTIFDRLKKFDTGIISKYCILLDFPTLGYNARAHVMIKAGKANKEELYEFLIKQKQVNSLYKINNGFDFMIDIIFDNIRNLEAFIERLDDEFKVRSKITYYIIEEIKRESFLSMENDPYLALQGN